MMPKTGQNDHNLRLMNRVPLEKRQMKPIFLERIFPYETRECFVNNKEPLPLNLGNQ